MARLQILTRVLTSFSLFSLVLFGLVSSQTESSFATISVSDAYAQIHQAEGQVLTSKNLYNADLKLKEDASKSLAKATNAEAVLLKQSVKANQDLGKIAKDLYMNNSSQEMSLTLDLIENGPEVFSEDKKMIESSHQVGGTEARVAIVIRKQLEEASINTNLAISNYNNIVQKLITDKDVYQKSKASFDLLMSTNTVLFTGSGGTVFVDSPATITGALTAVARSLSYVGQAYLACSDGTCSQLCDHLAGMAWGYANSGYESAREHWAVMVATGHAHPGDTNPPVGALLFWDTGLYGHVAVYVGNGMIVTNMNGPQGLGVYSIPASQITQTWGAPYWGWSDPIFYGQLVNSNEGGAK